MTGESVGTVASYEATLCHDRFQYGGRLPARDGLVLIGLCCERQGPTLTDYVTVEAADALRRSHGFRVRAIVPTYEFLRCGIYDEKVITTISSRTHRLLARYPFDVIDTIENGSYCLRRLDRAFSLQRFVGRQFGDGISDRTTAAQMGLLEIADIMLATDEADTVVITDRDSLAPVKGATRVMQKHGSRHSLGYVMFDELPALDGKGGMYAADESRKLYLIRGDEEKLRSAVTTGGSLDAFHEKGGVYDACVIGIVESAFCDPATVSEHRARCSHGDFAGCAEHKAMVTLAFRGLVEDINSGDE